MKRSDLLVVLTATALLKPCFFKNKVNMAFASSFSDANKLGDTVLTPEVLYISDSPEFEQKKKSFRGK